MLAHHLFSKTDTLQVDSLDWDHEHIHVQLSITGDTAVCPKCAHASARVHSRYTRSCADLPWAGQAVRLRLLVRRFFCDNLCCERTTFVEQVPEFLASSARRTQRLTLAQRAIGLALGGEAGARLARQISMPTSPDTLLRLIRTSPEPEFVLPRALGIDDWAMRKGQTYGTILVDLERDCVIDLLPDRTTETVTAWLQQHPSIEVLSRDRASAYAQAGTAGAPQAIQVADRFHLLMNLRETVERFFDRHQADLRKVRLHAPAPTSTSSGAARTEDAVHSDTHVTPSEAPVISETRRQARFAEVRALKEQGWSRNRIARQLRMSVNTVSRYLHADEQLVLQVPSARAGKAEAYASYLQQRWQAGCHQPRHLWQEIQAQGFKGSESSVYRWVNRARLTGRLCAATDVPSGLPHTRSSATGRVLSSRQAAWLLLRAPEDLESHEQDWLSALTQVCPSVVQVHELAQRFRNMVKNRVGAELAIWLQAAQGSGLADLRNFAMGLRRDFEAVGNALKLPWSNGPTEGQVHRLKMIKRQMYGRAKFDLLRKRVLLS
jgi:transposase